MTHGTVLLVSLVIKNKINKNHKKMDVVVMEALSKASSRNKYSYATTANKATTAEGVSYDLFRMLVKGPANDISQSLLKPAPPGLLHH